MNAGNYQAGYREREHTADWELEIWAPDMPGLLEQAARGMYALSGASLHPAPRLDREIELDYADKETLIVDFLEELRYLGEMEGLGFDSFHFTFQPGKLLVQLQGAPLAQLPKEIKAVTYHNLKIISRGEGLQAQVVFDV